MATSWRCVSGSALLALALIGVRSLPAQDQGTTAAQTGDGVTKGPATVEKPDPLKRPLTDKERIAQNKVRIS